METPLTTSNSSQVPAITSVRTLVDIRRTSPRYRDLAPELRRAWLTTQVLYCNALNHQRPEPDILKVDVVALDTALAGNTALADLTQQEIAFAMFRGTMGDYGEYYGLTARTFAGFCRTFIRSAVKEEAVRAERKAAEPVRGSWVLERMEYHRKQVERERQEQEERDELDDRLEGWKRQIETITKHKNTENNEH